MSGLVIFDCDGVLVDSELIFARVLAEWLIAVDFPATVDEAITLGFGKNRASLSAAVAARFGQALPDTFLETFAARSAAAFERELSPMAGVEDLLAALPTLRRFERPSGPRPPTACVDGAPAILRPARVQRLASRLRQAPDLFLFAAHQLGARPGDCTVVEDSVPGVEAAIAAQIRVVGFAVADTVRMIIPIG